MGKARNIADSNLSNLTVDTNTLVIDSTNDRVGIGTASPADALHIARPSGTATYLRLLQTSVESWQIGMVASSPSLSFINSGVERMRLDYNGNLGIGTTSPESRFQVNTGTNDRIIFRGGSHSTLSGLTSAITFSRPDGATNLSAVMGWNSGGLALCGREGVAFATGGGGSYSTTVERMRITDTGNVGIGTSSPNTELQIGNARQFFVQPQLGGNEIYNSGIGFSGYFSTEPATPLFVLPAGRNTNGAAGISGSYNGNLDFYTYNAGSTSASSVALTTARRMTLDSSGNLGVGTSNPSQRIVAETSNGLISVGPTGWRASERASVLIRTKTNNPAEIDLQNTNSGLNYGWQISCRDSTTPTLNFYSNSDGFFTEQFKLTHTGLLQFNSGYGSVATAYGCRAWVCFNGAGTLAIKASGNVSSVTDNGSGDYTINFNIAMPDANYAIATCGVMPDDAGGAPAFFLRGPTGWGNAPTLKTTSQARMLNRRETNLDMADCSVSIFR